jgi:hypothetical protein
MLHEGFEFPGIPQGRHLCEHVSEGIRCNQTPDGIPTPPVRI